MTNEKMQRIPDRVIVHAPAVREQWHSRRIENSRLAADLIVIRRAL